MSIHDKAVENMINNAGLFYPTSSITSICEICGSATESINTHLCRECIDDIRWLKKLREADNALRKVENCNDELNIKYYIATTCRITPTPRHIDWEKPFDNVEDAVHEASSFCGNARVYAVVDDYYIYAVEYTARDNVGFKSLIRLGHVNTEYRFSLKNLEENPSEYYQYAQTTIGDLFTINRLHAVKMENKNEDTSR